MLVKGTQSRIWRYKHPCQLHQCQHIHHIPGKELLLMIHWYLRYIGWVLFQHWRKVLRLGELPNLWGHLLLSSLYLAMMSLYLVWYLFRMQLLRQWWVSMPLRVVLDTSFVENRLDIFSNQKSVFGKQWLVFRSSLDENLRESREFVTIRFISYSFQKHWEKIIGQGFADLIFQTIAVKHLYEPCI